METVNLRFRAMLNLTAYGRRVRRLIDKIWQRQNLVGQLKVEGDIHFFLKGPAVHQEWIVTPMLDCLDGGLSQGRVPALHFEVIDASVFRDCRLHNHGSRNTHVKCLWRVNRVHPVNENSARKARNRAGQVRQCGRN